MELIGKAAIHPLLFYSGKVFGYATWISTILAWFGVGILHGAWHGERKDPQEYRNRSHVHF